MDGILGLKSASLAYVVSPGPWKTLRRWWTAPEEQHPKLPDAHVSFHISKIQFVGDYKMQLQ